MRTNYSSDTVRALVENYAVVAEKRDTNPAGMFALLQIIDVDRALAQLSTRLWEVVLLHGMLGIPQVETARILQVSQQAVSKRYRQGLEETHYLMNGGT